MSWLINWMTHVIAVLSGKVEWLKKLDADMKSAVSSFVLRVAGWSFLAGAVTLEIVRYALTGGL
ncbi:MAG: hypothetical protein RIN56_13840 [Sporomusaceae bacterium]|nr:hypothetical protein [Sporomusaceae bacterium]